MTLFFTVVHVLLSVLMIFVILLQPGKDAGMGSALGGGSATSAFGGRGAVTVLSKVTGVCAALFFITSLGLSFVGMTSSVAATGLPAAVPAPISPAPVAADAGTSEATAVEAAPATQAPAAGQTNEAPAAEQPATQSAPADAGAPAPVPAQ